jgi:hypothetical protein
VGTSPEENRTSADLTGGLKVQYTAALGTLLFRPYIGFGAEAGLTIDNDEVAMADSPESIQNYFLGWYVKASIPVGVEVAILKELSAGIELSLDAIYGSGAGTASNSSSGYARIATSSNFAVFVDSPEFYVSFWF